MTAAIPQQIPQPIPQPIPQHWKGKVDADWHRPSNHRTVLHFPFDGDALAVANEWAGHLQKETWGQSTYPPVADLLAIDRDGTRLYGCNNYTYVYGRKILPPGKSDQILVSIRQLEGQVHLEAWLSEHGWYRIFSPAEQAIHGGGFRQRLGRWLARQFVNPLVEALGQPPIH